MIFVLSQGCAANFGDGEKIARVLSRHHEVRFDFPEAGADAEAFFLNVCTVKGNAQAIKLLTKVHDAYPDVLLFVTGCAPKDFREEAVKIHPQVKFTSLKEIPALYGDDTGEQVRTSTLRESPFTGIVNIEEGCMDACAFCSTRLVKGRLHSFAPELIVEQVGALVNDGCYEIQLTGQDCACYGFDIGTNLAELVQKILAKVPGNYKIRLGMGNPRHMSMYLEALLDCFADERLYKFVHIPVQSGSDRVLLAMNRKHTAEDFRRLATLFNTRFPRFTLSTDLIVGFPGEAQSDFEQTLRLVEETRPTVCNITRFVARPGTPAARAEASADAVDGNIKHERSALLFDTFQKIAEENNRKWVGETCTVVTEKKGYREGTTICRNAAYRPVAIPGDYPAGTSLRVRITGAEPFALIAEVL
ncbi:MAG: tRNA (N(6)-L-threonylcarbamoyladenosine(37)-C(2))-methylthiotransferase [Fibrobacter sp.]|nr:tRNA (N(6)-L-threonylcarbamoyladenosine(37)-C(2))-methylthiotransferase [Fibrobacter sp.]